MLEFEGLWELQFTKLTLDNLFDKSLILPLEVGEKSDVEIRVRGVLAAGNGAGEFIGYMKDN